MIYFIQSQSDKRIKIGHSDNPITRLRQLRTGSSSAEPYVVLAVLSGGYKRETELKSRFKKYRSHGEWFNSAPEILDFIKHQTFEKGELKHCRVCGVLHLVTPEDSDIKYHGRLHKAIRQGAYPYSIREFMKEMAWIMLGSDGSNIEIRNLHNDEDLKRVIVYAWWARERENGLGDADFEDFILDYMEYLDVRFSGNKEELKEVTQKLEKHWGKV